MTRYEFKERWKIVGTLTTLSPLHVGDGDTTTLKRRDDPAYQPEKPEPEPEIASVMTDHKGRAYIPASSLKGALRSLGLLRISKPGIVQQVFGEQDSRGLAEFWDADVSSVPAKFDPGRQWCAQRLTCVAARTAIDRVTRTAKEHKLFQLEFVPAGISFKVTICGTGLSNEQIIKLNELRRTKGPDWGATEAEDHLQVILFLLGGGSNSSNTILLGAETESGFGRCEWKLESIHRLRKDDVTLELLENQQQGYCKSNKIGDAEQTALVAASRSLRATEMRDAVFKIKLAFDGPFLVNDPSAAGEDPKPNHAPLRRPDGRAYLPATSLRGALRSQAERIHRTITQNPEAPGASDDAYLEKFTIQSEADLGKLQACPVSQLFGAPGWRAPLRFSDFVSPTETYNYHQEFVAVDRFTGGGADGLKFNAEAVLSPTFEGTITLDLNRLETVDPEGKTLPLLAYTLRDLAQGDVRLGFGASKGYGYATATVFPDLPAWIKAPYADWLRRINFK